MEIDWFPENRLSLLIAPNTNLYTWGWNFRLAYRRLALNIYL